MKVRFVISLVLLVGFHGVPAIAAEQPDPENGKVITVWIEGAVSKSGKYEIKGEGLEGLLREGGLASPGGGSITVVRGIPGEASRIYQFYRLVGVTKYHPRIVDGDVVVVSQKPHPDYTEINRDIDPDIHQEIEVAVMGKVAQPGRYRMKEGDSLWEVIEKAGGLTPEAWRFITITRGLLSDNKQAFRIDRRDKEREVDPPLLKDGDIVYVSAVCNT